MSVSYQGKQEIIYFQNFLSWLLLLLLLIVYCQWVLRIKQQEQEADRSSPFFEEVNSNAFTYISNIFIYELG